MTRLLAGVLVGIVLGAGGLLLVEERRTGELGRAGEEATDAAREAGKLLDARIEVLELQASRIRREMAEQGRVIRRRARDLGERVADEAADARATVAIKARLAADPELSALDISVNTAAGVVTLGGTVAAPDLVGRAMADALEADGVREVVSTIRVRGP